MSPHGVDPPACESVWVWFRTLDTLRPLWAITAGSDMDVLLSGTAPKTRPASVAGNGHRWHYERQ